MDLMDWLEAFLAGFIAALGCLMLLSSAMGENQLKTNVKHQAWVGAGFLTTAAGKFVEALGLGWWALAVIGVGTLMILWSLRYLGQRDPDASGGARALRNDRAG